MIWNNLLKIGFSGILFIFIVLTHIGLAQALIVDNTDADFSVVGTWQSSSFITGFYGTDYLYAKSGDGSGTATWTFDISSSGEYDIYGIWTEHRNRAPDAPYSIYNNSVLENTILVNQQVAGGQFSLLGRFSLEPGTLEVVLSDDAAGYVVADAIKLEAVDPTPVAGFSGSPTSGSVPLTVSFTDESTGSIDSWSWDFDGDGVEDSAVRNPSYEYGSSGNYTVTLTVSGPGGSDDEAKVDYIKVTAVDPTPVAGFSGSPTSGSVPLTVSFTDESTGSIDSWSWDFDGDGVEDSAVRNPSYEYGSSGNYTVTLTVSGPGGSDDEAKVDYIKVTAVDPTPVAGFSGSPTSGSVPLTVSFTDESTGSIDSWSWDFDGDGVEDSAVRNPSYEYGSSGNYTVTLTVSGPGGSDDEAKVDYIKVTDAGYPLIVDNTDADFSVVGTWPSSSFITGFYGTDYLYAKSGDGSGTATWTFDISSSGEYDIYGIWTEHRNRAPDAPYSIYNNSVLENTILVNQQVAGGQFSLLGRFSLEPGTLEVVLSDDAAGYVVADAIKLEAVDPTPVAGFSGSPTSGSVPLTVSFTDESTGSIDSWSWDFDGDGVEDSAVRNPSYEYGSSGNYTVTLTVSGPGGSDDEAKVDYIKVTAVDPTPVAGFSGSPTSGSVPLTVSFTDESTGSIDSWSWDFDGDGVEDSAVRNPSYEYGSSGNYTVTLTVSGPGGSDDEAKVDYIKVTAVDPTPVAGFSGSPTSGSVPLTVSFTDESTGSIDSWSWDFDGDGVEDSAVRNPLCEYRSSGNYTVILTVSGPGGSDDEAKVDYIKVTDAGDPLIVDNTDADFSVVGTWPSSSFITGFYGTDYLYAESGDGSGTVTWTFDITSSGEYYIYAMWTEHSNRAPDAPYSAYNNGQLLDTVSVDQRSDGGQFNLLGNYQLESGTVYIRLTDDVSSGFIVADAVMLNDQECNFSIMSPNDLDLLVSQEVEIRVSMSGFPEEWHAEIVFDGDFTNPILAGNCDPPSGNEVCAYLSDVSLGEHTVDAYMVDGSNSSQPFSDYVGFGIGDYYVAIGDSITRGSHDDISADNTSQDGRNSGGGYEPILNNHITITREYAHTVINEGVSGDSSADGIILLPSLLSEHPNSEYYLVQYGTNDAWDPVPSGLHLHPVDSGYPGTFKDNMQQIIDQIRADGKEPFLAKVPIAYEPYSYLNDHLNKYNQVIDELIGENNINVEPPDFYTLFENNPDQIADGLHPNGTGYQSMAQEWHDVLVTAF